MITRRTFLDLGLGILGTTTGWSALANRRKGKTILILGGTGFIGPHLTQEALRLGWSVTHFNRGITKQGISSSVETLIGDRAGDLKSLQGRKWDVMIDNTGYIPKFVKNSAQLLAPNVGYCIYTSSVCAYESFRSPNNEDSPKAKPPDPGLEEMEPGMYGPMKVLCEQYCTDAFGGRLAIVRPGYVAGPGDESDRLTYWVARVSKGGEMIAPGRPRDPIQLIDVRDLVTWMMTLAEIRITGIFNAASPPYSFTIGDLISLSERASPKSRIKVTWVPQEFLMQNLGKGVEKLFPWLPPKGNTAAAALTSVARATSKGLVSRPLWLTVRDTLTWFESLPIDRRTQLRTGLEAHEELEVLTTWRESDAYRKHSAPAESGKEISLTFCA